MSNPVSPRWPSVVVAACLVTLGAACGSSSDSPPTSSGGSSGQSSSGGANQPSGSGGATATSSGGSTTPVTVGSGGQVGSGSGGVNGSGGTPASGGAAGPVGGARGGGTGGTMGGGAGAGPGPGAGSAGAGGPSLCPTAGTVFCDGFEGAAPGAAGSDWTTMGTITVDTTKAYRGTKSVKFTGALAYILEKKTFTGTTKMTNNSFWARYYFLSNLTGTAPATHVWFGALADAANSGDQFHFAGGSRGKLQAEIRLTSDRYTDAMVPAANTTSPNYPTLADGWQCWEFHVSADDSFEFFVNGKEVTEMRIVAGKASKSGVMFSPMPLFGGLYLGWQDFGGASLTGWLDEVAIGPSQIGCGN